MVLAMVAERIKARKAEKEDTVLRFTNGEISRKQAMKILDISYTELLDLVAERRLEIPEVSDEEAERMANDMVAVLDGVRR